MSGVFLDGQPVTLDGVPVFLDGAEDVTAPTVLSATISSNGLNLTIAFSEPVTGSLGFTLGMSGGPVTMTYAGGSGTGLLSYTLSRTTFVDETGTLAYADGDVEDLAGNALEALSEPVVNESTQEHVIPPPDPTPPPTPPPIVGASRPSQRVNTLLRRSFRIRLIAK